MSLDLNWRDREDPHGALDELLAWFHARLEALEGKKAADTPDAPRALPAPTQDVPEDAAPAP